MRLVLVVLASVIAVGAIACGDNLAPDRSPELALHDEIFAGPADHGVLCAANSDDLRYSLDSILGALDRARDEGRVVQLFMHDPGGTVSPSKIEAILAGARDRGLRFVTDRELALGTPAPPGGGLALGFDDWFVADWTAQRDLLARYGARVTFFVALYTEYTDDQKAQIRALAGDGHDIEYHGTFHLNAPSYVAANGMDAYLAEEVEPALAAMRADGYDPIVFAYPAGFRTPELDATLLPRFRALRSTTVQCPHLDE